MNEEQEANKPLKIGFFKKIWYSITKIEKYPDMASEGLGRAFIYVCKLVALLVIVICLGTMYQTYKILDEGLNYIQNEFPEFNYKDGNLKVDSSEKIEISEKNSYFGKTIINTNDIDENTINQYINEITKSGSGIIILKDKIIIKNGTMGGTVNYNYDEILGKMKIAEFTKQSVIDYAKSPKIASLYISIFSTVFIYGFIVYLLTTISNAIFLFVFGFLTTWLARIKMKIIAIFNMTIYALTLSILLNIIYFTVNIFTSFNIKYFQVMYISVAAIYLVAAIFILKSEFIKKQAEMMKIVEAQEIVKKELEEQEKKEKEKAEKEERKQKDKKEESEKNNKESNKSRR